MPSISSSGAGGRGAGASGPSGAAEGATDAAMLTVAAVARRLGIAPATLRTWDRRYGLGPSEHRAGAHRRYTRADLARLSLMRRLTLEGVPPGEAAGLALAAPDEEAEAALRAVEPAPVDVGSPRARAGGGRVIALPQAEPAVRGLARAAMSLDAVACVDIVSTSLQSRGVVPTWDDLLVPVLVAVGERWAVTGQGIDVEHLLSECVLGALRSVHGSLPASPAASTEGRWVLLASAENEQHSLPVHVLAAALAERGVRARVLGAQVPREALAAAIRRSGPAVVFLWSQLAATGRAAQLAELPALRPAPRVVIGGPGWDDGPLPPGVHRAASLAEALEEVLAASGR